jgi:hypothetical protein
MGRTVDFVGTWRAAAGLNAIDLLPKTPHERGASAVQSTFESRDVGTEALDAGITLVASPGDPR